MRCSVIALAALAAAVVAAPRPQLVLHETRPAAAAHAWRKTARLNPDTVLPVRIGLAQQNTDRADALLAAVADPASPAYGRHWSQKQVADMFAPSPAAVDAVRRWIADALGLDAETDTRLARGWLAFNATARDVEALLQTEYHVYRHAGHGGRHVACDQYHVPAHLRAHIDIVTPTVHFDGRLGAARAAQKSLKKRADVLPTAPQPLAMQGAVVENALMGLDQCDAMITPACLQALYGIPAPSTRSGRAAAANNSIGIVEYTPQAFLPADLDLFFSQFGQKSQQKMRPVVRLLDNAVLQTQNQSFALNGESALDLEYAMALVAPQTATLFQVGDASGSASFDTLLEAFDSQYCTGTDDDDCGVVSAPHVLSTSYSYNEADLTPAYEQRQCLEYLKLGLQGVTVVYSSGDYGVAGNGGVCLENNSTGGRFNPSFPGTCPYVTSVGATQVASGASVRAPEVACETVIQSGGGFSDVFAMPAYQQAAVAAYFRMNINTTTTDKAGRFNDSQTVRAYPDVAANGANYVTAVDGNFTLSYGTSASAPVFAAVVNLLNERRMAAGKGPVGFVNPVLYAHPEVLNDITSGANPGCGTGGFEAAAGWDPVTGLGTPNYPAMEKLFLSLP